MHRVIAVLLLATAAPAVGQFETGRVATSPKSSEATAEAKPDADAAKTAAAAAKTIAPAPPAPQVLRVDSAVALAPSEQWLGWRTAWSSPVSATVQNPVDRPVQLIVTTDDFRRMAGEAFTPAAGALTLGGFTAGPGCQRYATGVLRLEPLARCVLTFTPRLEAPGDYRVRLSVRGSGVAESAELRLLAGRGWCAALLALVIGGAIGGSLAFLRGPFAERAAAYADAIRLRDRREALVALARRAMPIEGRDGQFLRNFISQHLAQVYDGRAGVANISNRLELLEQLVWQAQRAEKLQAAAREALSPSFSDAIDGLENPDVQKATATLEALAKAVDAALVKQRTDAAQFAGRNFESAVAGAAIDAPYVPIFPRNVSAASLARLRVDGEMIAAALVFALFALIALLELWDGHAAWGTFRDIVIAMLAGAGVFGGSAAIVQGLRQNVKSL